MPSVPVSLETLNDGKSLKAFNEAIEAANQDTLNNPFNCDARKVIITYWAKPPKKDGGYNTIGIQIKTSFPGYCSESSVVPRDGVFKIESEVQPVLPGMEKEESDSTLQVVKK